MRDLETNDIFKMSRILKKMALDIDLKGIETKDKTDEQVGLEVVARIIKRALENLYMAQDEVNSFMGDLIGITGEEFGKLPIEESMKSFIEFKGKMPKDFFKLAGKMI